MKTLIGVLTATFLAAIGIASPAMSAPQGPWVLPASDISAPVQGAFGPQITTAPDGTATAVWYRSDGANNIIQAATRPPGGSFGAPVDLSVAGRNATFPQITTAPDGTATVVWRRYNGSNMIIQAATRPPGGSFGPAVDLSASGQRAIGPQITTAPDGTATAIWSRFSGSNWIVQATTRPPGGSFGAPVGLSAPGQSCRGAFGPQITTAPDGTATAVWIRFNGSNDIVQVATRPPGESFGPPADLSAPGGDAFAPQVATAPDGTTTAVWERFDGNRFDGADNIIQAASRPPGGSFGAPVDLSVPGRDGFSPQVVTAPDGTTTAVWGWGRYNGANNIIQAATRPPGGSFGPAVDLSAPGPSAFGPQITTAPDGTATAVWIRFNGSNDIVQVATRPPGESFGPPADLSAPGGDAFAPQVATAPDGTTTAVWERFDGSDFIIQAATRPPGGSFGAPVGLSLPAGKPRLANLKIKPKSKKVRRGKKVTFKVKVRNTGNATAKELKVCGKGPRKLVKEGPKKLVKVPKCRKPGKLAAGKAKTVKFKVKVKNSAKKGQKAKITFTATATGAKKKSGKATVKIR